MELSPDESATEIQNPVGDKCDVVYKRRSHLWQSKGDVFAYTEKHVLCSFLQGSIRREGYRIRAAVGEACSGKSSCLSWERQLQLYWAVTFFYIPVPITATTRSLLIRVLHDLGICMTCWQDKRSCYNMLSSRSCAGYLSLINGSMRRRRNSDLFSVFHMISTVLRS